MSEPDMIIRARQGDGTAWQILVRQHQEAAFRLAYLILGDAADAEDAAQEAFIRAFQALDRFDASRPFRPWLLSIAANMARNKRRSAGRYFAAVRRFVQHAPEPLTSADDKQTRRDEAQVLWQAVRRLKDTDQEIIYLRFFLELSVNETAQSIGIAPGTVKSRLHRALERLQKVIEQDFPALKEGYVL